MCFPLILWQDQWGIAIPPCMETQNSSFFFSLNLPFNAGLQDDQRFSVIMLDSCRNVTSLLIYLRALTFVLLLHSYDVLWISFTWFDSVWFKLDSVWHLNQIFLKFFKKSNDLFSELKSDLYCIWKCQNNQLLLNLELRAVCFTYQNSKPSSYWKSVKIWKPSKSSRSVQIVYRLSDVCSHMLWWELHWLNFNQ